MDHYKQSLKLKEEASSIRVLILNIDTQKSINTTHECSEAQIMVLSPNSRTEKIANASSDI